MRGRFDTPHLTCAEVHDILSTFRPVRTEPINDLEPNDDVGPTNPQWVAPPASAAHSPRGVGPAARRGLARCASAGCR